MKKTIAGLTLAVSTLFIQSPAMACSAEPLLGSVCLLAGDFCPRGYTSAEGQLLSISQNSALFSLLGTTYGGDGRTTFALPDLRGRIPVGIGQGPGLQSVNQGQKRGSESRQLNVNELPAHTHSATATGDAGVEIKVSTEPGNSTTPANGHNHLAASPNTTVAKAQIWTDSPTNTVALGGVTNTGGNESVTVGDTGGNQPFSILPPQLGLRYCIATVGVYPSRD